MNNIKEGDERMTEKQEREYREYLLDEFKKWELMKLTSHSRTILNCYMKFDEIIFKTGRHKVEGSIKEKED